MGTSLPETAGLLPKSADAHVLQGDLPGEPAASSFLRSQSFLPALYRHRSHLQRLDVSFGRSVQPADVRV